MDAEGQPATGIKTIYGKVKDEAAKNEKENYRFATGEEYVEDAKIDRIGNVPPTIALMAATQKVEADAQPHRLSAGAQAGD